MEEVEYSTADSDTHEIGNNSWKRKISTADTHEIGLSTVTWAELVCTV